ncbi:hypothetical protein ECANGB1_102 [Enterospora canceri]|uniref:Uncharacterized protein n=1 Tax=Enterospora canceri TaxID=1081671 RepID=A0A1Y1S4P5_9MICR|nr:hypothetical protein ECANGB1_102 [Enterospora canceri]
MIFRLLQIARAEEFHLWSGLGDAAIKMETSRGSNASIVKPHQATRFTNDGGDDAVHIYNNKKFVMDHAMSSHTLLTWSEKSSTIQNQRFDFQETWNQGKKYFKLEQNGRCATLDKGSNKVKMETCSSSYHQVFTKDYRKVKGFELYTRVGGFGIKAEIKPHAKVEMVKGGGQKVFYDKNDRRFGLADATNLVLDMAGSSGKVQVLYDKPGESHQNVEFKKRGHGYIVKVNGKCLEADKHKMEFVLNTCKRSRSQMFVTSDKETGDSDSDSESSSKSKSSSSSSSSSKTTELDAMNYQVKQYKKLMRRNDKALRNLKKRHRGFGGDSSNSSDCSDSGYKHRRGRRSHRPRRRGRYSRGSSSESYSCFDTMRNGGFGGDVGNGPLYRGSHGLRAFDSCSSSSSNSGYFRRFFH